MANKARREILKAADDLGLKIKEIQWEPIGPAAEMCGNSGGWRVEDSDGRDYLGYNFSEVIQDMRNSVKYRMWEREAQRHFRFGLRAAAKEKDARIAALVSAIQLGSGVNVSARAMDAIREYRNLILHQFVMALYRETDHHAHLRYKTPDEKPIPPSELRDVWAAIESLMSAEFGEYWRDAR